MNTVDTLFQSLAQVFGHYYTLFFVWFMALPPEQHFGLIALTICALLVLELGLFTYKTLLTALLRAVGLSSPNHYHRWPRVLPWSSPLKLKMSSISPLRWITPREKQSSLRNRNRSRSLWQQTAMPMT